MKSRSCYVPCVTSRGLPIVTEGIAHKEQTECIGYLHHDFYGRTSRGKKAVFRYISARNAPKHLIVQATLRMVQSQPAVDW